MINIYMKSPNEYIYSNIRNLNKNENQQKFEQANNLDKC